MSRLLKFLEGVRRGGEGFGFTARAAAAAPALAIVVVVPGMRDDLVKAAAREGADGIALAVTWEGVQSATALAAATGAAGDKPVGLLLESPSAEGQPDSGWWANSGLDFLVVQAEQPAYLLAIEIAKLVSLRLDFDPMQVRALDGLSVEGFVVSGEGERAGLTIGDASRYRLLAGATGKPVLAALSEATSRAELQALSQAGVDGIVLLPAALGSDAASAGGSVAGVKAEIARLGPRRTGRNRTGQAVPLLPRVGPGLPPEGQEERGR